MTQITMNFTMENRDERTELLFGWLDFTLFALMLGVSTLIGVYFGVCGKKEDTPKEYLHGGKTMSIIPVAVSLAVSVISGITVMGVPSEVYTFGTLYWLTCISSVIVGLINNYFYLPVFYELQLTSTYEYLQLRFSKKVRIMASVLYTVGLLLYIPIVVYVPALALSQVSGMNIYYVAVITSILCIFYTMMGGIKAVVWTDFLQGVVMLVSSLAVVALGLTYVGGFTTVWERNRDAGRIRVFEMNLSPFERLTFWSVVLGDIFGWMGTFVVNQAMVQKFMTLPTYDNARRALTLSIVGLIVIRTISCFTGLLIYAAYHDCDPLETKAISRSDQLLPYYIMDIAASIPGLPGLFVAGIFSAALSTISSSLNALGATLFEDFVRPCLKEQISERSTSTAIRFVVVIFGAICVAIVFVVDKLGGVVQLSIAAGGVTSGAMLGLFTFGMFYPRGNTQGALVGSITSMLFMGWIVFGNQKAIADGNLKQHVLPTSVEGCGFNTTFPASPMSQVYQEPVLILFKISFMYYTALGMLVMLVVGAVVSAFTEPPDLKRMNPALFTPYVRKFVEARSKDSAGTEQSEMMWLNAVPPDVDTYCVRACKIR